MVEAGLPSTTPDVFGYTSYDKHTAGTSSTGGTVNPAGNTSLVSLTNPDPASWVIDPFGPAPGMSAPDPISAVAWSAPTLVTGTIAAMTPLTDTTPGGPPLDLDNWSVVEGLITAADCPPGAECGQAMVATDFYQREITKDGKRYFQTIITDGNATGTPATGNENYLALVSPTVDYAPSSLLPGVLTYANESFVQAGAQGLSAKQQIVDLENADAIYPLSPPIVVGEVTYTEIPITVARTLSFTSATLNTGWAQGGSANPTVQLAQLTTSDIDSAGGFPDSMMSRFDMYGLSNGAKELKLAQDNGWFGLTDELGFRMHQIDGALQNNTHLLVDPVLLPDGGNIAWSPGDSIKAVWSGARAFSGNAAFYGVQYVGLTAYTNLTTGESVALTLNSDSGNSIFPDTGYLAAEAASWVAPFNTSAPAPPGFFTIPDTWGAYGCNYSYNSGFCF
jgi:hypothetical protein